MRHLFILMILLSFFVFAEINAQCNTVGIQISSSDTMQIQLYNAGFFNIPSGFANVCNWEVTTFDGGPVFEEITMGTTSAEQSFALFEHMVPITDSMFASLVIENEEAGLICTITDTLYWEETEVLPGSFIGSWSVLSNNVGVEETISSIVASEMKGSDVKLFPSPAKDFFSIQSDRVFQSVSIYNMQGQLVTKLNDTNTREKIYIGNLPIGVFFVSLIPSFGEPIIKHLVKH